MSKQMPDGKFGLVIPALTEARISFEANPSSPQSQDELRKAMQETSPLKEKVEAFLEKNDAMLVSGCGTDMFGVITSEDDPKAPCGITFYGPRSLAEAVANEFPYKVISADDGTPIPRTAEARVLQFKQKPRP